MEQKVILTPEEYDELYNRGRERLRKSDSQLREAYALNQKNIVTVNIKRKDLSHDTDVIVENKDDQFNVGRAINDCVHELECSNKYMKEEIKSLKKELTDLEELVNNYHKRSRLYRFFNKIL